MEELELRDAAEQAQALVGLLVYLNGGEVFITRDEADAAIKEFAGKKVEVFNEPERDGMTVRLVKE